MTDAIWQLLYPMYGGEYGILDLSDLLIVEQGRGMPPMHYNVQRGVYQHGETPINLRLDPRVIQIAVARDHDNRTQMYANMAALLGKVNPSRNWSIDNALTKCIYRKIMPGGKRQWRSDLTTTVGSNTVMSATGRFVEWGLDAGSEFIIVNGADVGTYVVRTVINETTLQLTQAMSATGTDVQYRVQTGCVTRDLHVLLESGPALEDDLRDDSFALADSVRLIAHDPVWRNPHTQTITWAVSNLSNLIFYEPVSWEDRMVFPIWFGEDQILAESSLTYLGTWPSRPIVVVNGPFSTVTLENVSTNTKLTMTYDAAIGEQVTIDLEALTVTNNFGQNLMRYMSTPYAAADSDLIGFGLYGEPQVSGGINIMNVHMSGAVLGHTSATMYWHTRYIGV